MLATKLRARHARCVGSLVHAGCTSPRCEAELNGARLVDQVLGFVKTNSDFSWPSKLVQRGVAFTGNVAEGDSVLFVSRFSIGSSSMGAGKGVVS